MSGAAAAVWTRDVVLEHDGRRWELLVHAKPSGAGAGVCVLLPTSRTPTGGGPAHRAMLESEPSTREWYPFAGLVRAVGTPGRLLGRELRSFGPPRGAFTFDAELVARALERVPACEEVRLELAPALLELRNGGQTRTIHAAILRLVTNDWIAIVASNLQPASGRLIPEERAA